MFRASAVALFTLLVSCGRPAVAPGEKHVLLPRMESPVDLKAEGLDSSIFKEATSDPAIIKILARGLPPVAGKVTKSGDRDVLEWKGRKVFEAAVIGDIRCQSAVSDILALQTITAPGGKPLQQPSDGPLLGNLWEIWIVRSDGQAEQVSPPAMNATFPVISPDGRYLAFTVEPLQQGFLGSAELMIKDLQEGTVRTYSEKRNRSDYKIAPVDWVKEGSTLTLRVVDEWGETGGHLTLKQVRVE